PRRGPAGSFPTISTSTRPRAAFLLSLDSEISNANRALRSMWAIEDELRSRGAEARRQLIPLLDPKNRLVRYYAAKALLGIVPERARAVIEWNAKYGFDSIAGDAAG